VIASVTQRGATPQKVSAMAKKQTKAEKAFIKKMDAQEAEARWRKNADRVFKRWGKQFRKTA
jgi:hypothetical protein